MSRPLNKRMLIIGLVSVGLIGSIGTGVFFAVHNGADQAGHRAEEKVKIAADKKSSKWDDILDKQEAKVHKNGGKKDVLGRILDNDRQKERKIAAILDADDQTNQVSPSNVALKVIDDLPSAGTGKRRTVAVAIPPVKPVPTTNGDLSDDTHAVPIDPPNNEPRNPVPPVVPPDNGRNDGDKPDGNDNPPPIPEPINESPQLFASNQTLSIGSKVDPYAYATATDAEDGDLTSKIQVIYNNVHPDIEGTYKIVYQVSDSGGKSTKLAIEIVIVNEAPEIQAQDVTLSQGDTFDPLAHVTASDREDGDLTKEIVIAANNVDTSKEGIYQVTYEVKDHFGKAAKSKTIQVEVVNDVPVIMAQDKEIHVGDTFDPLENVTATDKQDGDITSKIEVKENHVNSKEEGLYKVVLTVTDSGGKTRQVSYYVKVVPAENDETITPDDLNKANI